MARPDQTRDASNVATRRPFDGDDPVAGLQAGRRGRRAGSDRGDLAWAGRRPAADGEDDEEDEERDEDVRERPGGDHGDALPRRRAPVRVRRRALLDVAQRRARPSAARPASTVRGDAPRARARRTRLGRRRSPRRRARGARAARPARGAVAPRIAGPSRSCRSRAAGRCMPGSRTTRRAGSSRSRTRSRALDLHERRREADVEAPRPHPDRERDAEVPELVDEDEQRRDRR